MARVPVPCGRTTAYRPADLLHPSRASEGPQRRPRHGALNCLSRSQLRQAYALTPTGVAFIDRAPTKGSFCEVWCGVSNHWVIAKVVQTGPGTTPGSTWADVAPWRAEDPYWAFDGARHRMRPTAWTGPRAGRHLHTRKRSPEEDWVAVTNSRSPTHQAPTHWKCDRAKDGKPKMLDSFQLDGVPTTSVEVCLEVTSTAGGRAVHALTFTRAAGNKTLKGWRFDDSGTVLKNPRKVITAAKQVVTLEYLRLHDDDVRQLVPTTAHVVRLAGVNLFAQLHKLDRKLKQDYGWKWGPKRAPPHLKGWFEYGDPPAVHAVRTEAPAQRKQQGVQPSATSGEPQSPTSVVCPATPRPHRNRPHTHGMFGPVRLSQRRLQRCRQLWYQRRMRPTPTAYRSGGGPQYRRHQRRVRTSAGIFER